MEEYVDELPSPLKKKREVDVKHRPSKSRIAAEKYKCSKFVTKLTNLPKPVHRRSRAVSTAPKQAQTSTQSDMHDMTNPERTTTIPAISQEAQEAIEHF